MRAIAIDTETTGLNLFHGDKPFAFSACDDQGQTYWLEYRVDIKTRQPAINKKGLQSFVDMLLNYDEWVFHHSKFDIRAFSTVGIDLWQLIKKHNIKLHDTVIASHINNSKDNHKLKPLSLKYLDIPDTDEEDLQKAVIKARALAKKKGYELEKGTKQFYWLPKFFNPNDVTCEKYGTNDPIRTIKLHFLFQKELAKDEKKLAMYNREMALVKVFYDMESRGLPVKRNNLVSERQRFTELQVAAERKLVSMVGREDFNFNSPKQMQEYLFKTLKLPPQRETKSGHSTDADTIDALIQIAKVGTKAHSFLTALLQNRKASSACSYLDQYYRLSINQAGRGWTIHTTVNQTGQATTRISTENPNGQNVSVKEEMPLRMAFGPHKGFLWYDIDYDNVEMRILAKLSGEQRLIDLFRDGGSYHLLIAEILHGSKHTWKGLNKNDWKKSPEYKTTKNGNFSRGYGAGEYTTDRTYGIDGAHKKLAGEFKHWTAYNQEMISIAKKQGYIETEFGYPLYVERARAYTTSLNYKIQGTAGDIIKEAILNFDKALANNPKLLGTTNFLLQVHDELIYEIPIKEKNNELILSTIIDCMEEPGKRVGIGTPVTPSIVETSWDNSTIIPKPIAAKTR